MEIPNTPSRENGPTLKRFRQSTTLLQLQEILSNKSLNWRLQSATSSHTFSQDSSNITTFENIVDYLGELDDGKPLVASSFLKSIFEVADGRWEKSSESIISEADFYGNLAYGKPDFVVNIQRVLFSYCGEESILELHMEGKSLVLATGDLSGRTEALFGDLVEPEALNFQRYMVSIFDAESARMRSDMEVVTQQHS